MLAERHAGDFFLIVISHIDQTFDCPKKDSKKKVTAALFNNKWKS